MDSHASKRWKSSRSMLKLMQSREVNASAAKALGQKLQFSENFVERLGLEAELEGHHGCVNCLEWSPDGLRLASGSDDTNVILWDPFRHKRLEVIPTPHIGNIFSVKFLADESVIATAAGDCRVVVQNIASSGQRCAPIMDCSCHVGRVKRLATAPDQPTLFWSAGEDGMVLQFDLREPHECPTQAKVLIDHSFRSEIKCVAVNPTKPHYIAIGSNDCYVRLYDRRMIRTSTPNIAYHSAKRSSPQPPYAAGCVQYYAAGHLARENASLAGVRLAVTYVAFDTAGTQMLANVGGEQIYLFDVNRARHIDEVTVPQYRQTERLRHEEQEQEQHGDGEGGCARSRRSLPRRLSNLKITKNSPVSNGKDAAPFYMRRALKFFQRRWMSDTYCAARDYLHVIQHWPHHREAYVGLIKCLIALKWTEQAEVWLNYYVECLSELFPDSQDKNSNDVGLLRESLEDLKSCSASNGNASATGKDGGQDGGGSGGGGGNSHTKYVEEQEKQLRLNSFDFERRYLGHCNTTTDIKEANFLGDDNYVCAGSDEGIIFIWDKDSMEIVRALQGDTSIVNCIQPHPSACLVASSGIDTAVKLWSPQPENNQPIKQVVEHITDVVEANQRRMCMDPFESMLASMGYQIQSLDGGLHEVPTCRTS